MTAGERREQTLLLEMCQKVLKYNFDVCGNRVGVGPTNERTRGDDPSSHVRSQHISYLFPPPNGDNHPTVYVPPILYLQRAVYLMEWLVNKLSGQCTDQNKAEAYLPQKATIPRRGEPYA